MKERHINKPLPEKADDPEQSKRFIDMADEVEANEDPEAFDRVFDEVVKPAKPSARHPRPSGKPPSS